MTVYAYRNDLLGSALMNFANAWGFAAKLGHRLCLNWIDPNPNRPPMPWREIIQPDERFDVIGIPPPPEAPAIPRTPASSATLPSRLLYPHTVWVQLDYEARAESEHRIRELLLSLKLVKPVSDAVKSILPYLGAFHAVHIRRGGDVIDLMTPEGDLERAASIFVKRYADLDTYRDAVNAAGITRPLVFSNDGPEARKLGKWVGDFEELQQLTPTQRDLAELLLMSRARTIIATRSNYSAFARLLGGCPLVLVHKWLTQERIDRMVAEIVPAHAAGAVHAAYRAVFSRQAPR